VHKKYLTFFPNIWNWNPWNYNQANQKHTLDVQRLMSDILSPKRWNNNFLTININKLQKHHMLSISIHFKLLIQVFVFPLLFFVVGLHPTCALCGIYICIIPTVSQSCNKKLLYLLVRKIINNYKFSLHMWDSWYNNTFIFFYYTGCPRRNVPDFRREFLMLKYTDITQNTYVQSWTVTEITCKNIFNLYHATENKNQSCNERWWKCMCITTCISSGQCI
jgi:hypothetical protein